jgi:hypothetical protein
MYCPQWFPNKQKGEKEGETGEKRLKEMVGDGVVIQVNEPDIILRCWDKLRATHSILPAAIEHFYTRVA